jgi:hypothetical protein
MIGFGHALSFDVDTRPIVNYALPCRLSRGHMKKTQTDLLQGTLDLLVLKTLQSGPTHDAAELVVRRQRETNARKNPMDRTLSGIMLEKRYCTTALDGRCW